MKTYKSISILSKAFFLIAFSIMQFSVSAINNCAANNTFKVNGLHSVWVNAGADNPYIFYGGITQGKLIEAKVLGGSGNYSYAWSNSAGFVLKPASSANKITLWEATGPTWVKVTITDVGQNCTFNDSVFINYSDQYICKKVGNTFYYNLCENGQNICMSGFTEVRSLILAGTHTLGKCPCVATNTFGVQPLHNVWVNAGANVATTFYYGVAQSKDITANVSGGVGPYTYSFSNSGGYTLQATAQANKIRLWEPTGATWVKATITDVGANCTFSDSVFINWSDEFVCYKQGNTFFYKLCENGNPVCLSGFTYVRSLIEAGTHTLGGCPVLKTEVPIVSQGLKIYPNPTTGELTIQLDGESNLPTTLEVFDINGRLLKKESILLKQQNESYQLNCTELINGFYILRTSSERNVKQQRFQIIK